MIVSQLVNLFNHLIPYTYSDKIQKKTFVNE